MAVLGIDGSYGIGKSSFLVSYGKDFKRKYGNKGIIVSNMKLFGPEFENYIYYDDSNILDVLRLLNDINNQERNNPDNYYFLKNGKREFKRPNFTKFLIMFDESGALLNKHQKKIFESALIQYVNQTRKINYDLVLTSVRGDENFKQLRDKVDKWYTLSQPFKKLPYVDGIRKVTVELRESDGITISTYKDVKKVGGEYKVVDLPIREHYGYFYKPFTYKNYDDWHKNLSDVVSAEQLIDILNSISIPDIILKKYGYDRLLSSGTDKF